MQWIESLWHFVWGWAGIDTIIGCAALAVAILEPKFLDAITDLRKWAICTAIVAFTFTGTIAYGYRNGLAEKQRQWDVALAKAVTDGEADRTAAVADEPATTDRSVFAHDIYNRDGAGTAGIKPQGKVRWLEAHHLFGKW